MRELLLAILLTLLLAACQKQEDYRVVVRIGDDALAAQADRIELSMLGVCGEVAIGEPPPPRTPGFVVERGAPAAAFGELPPGMHALYARAFDEDSCAVIGAGCAPVELERGGGGALVVELAPIPANGCPRGTTCTAGACMPDDVVVEMDAGVGVDAGPDPLPLGERWVESACGGEGWFCGDPLQGVYGMCRPTDMGIRCCAGCFDSATGRCERGWTDERCGFAGNECATCEAGDTCVSAYFPEHQCRRR